MQTFQLDLRQDETAILTIANLVGICHRCEQVFGEAVYFDACIEFRGGVGRVRQLLHQFGFQLRAELQRIDLGETGTFPITPDENTDFSNCESTLRHVLKNYQEVLDGRLPAHTRALVKRQYVELQQLFQELSSFVLVLQDLMEKRAGATA